MINIDYTRHMEYKFEEWEKNIFISEIQNTILEYNCYPIETSVYIGKNAYHFELIGVLNDTSLYALDMIGSL